MENETKPWPIFDRTYKRQNQLRKKAEERESSDDDIDSVCSNGDNDCPLAPPAPTFPFGREEKVYEGGLEEGVTSPRVSIFNKTGSTSLLKGNFSGEIVEEEQFIVEDSSPNNERFVGSLSEPHADAHSVTVQESGIPTSESPKKSSPVASTTQRNTASGSNAIFPAQALIQSTSTNYVKPYTVTSKPPRSARPNPDEKGDTVPRSIPLTICYSLRSAIGDGSVRQRNSHTLMDQRPLRPNGCAIDVSYWSHRGKRSYMEGECRHFELS